MFWVNIKRIIKAGFINFWRNGWVSLATILVMVITLFVASTVIAGFLVYQWRQNNGELKKIIQDKESLIREAEEIKKASFFKECKKLEIRKDDLMSIQLLNAFRADFQENIWNLIVIDPDGHPEGMGFPPETAGIEFGISERDEGMAMFFRKIGDYLILIAPGVNILPTDTYSLQLNSSLDLAKDAPFSPNLLDRLYILRQTEDAIIPIVPASVGCQY